MIIEKTKYPDGQISTRATFEAGVDNVLKTRINSYEDLFYVASAADSMRSVTNGFIHLYVPCLFGQRSDRRFYGNQSFDLKIICEFINNCRFHTVSVLDPHSSVSLALLDRCLPILPDEYVEKTIKALATEDLVLVSPDAGAYKKVYDYASKFDTPLVAGVKHRTKKGEVDLKFYGDVEGKPCLIIDDLADGGWTFHLLAQALKAKGASKVYLYVTHGMFFRGFDLLKENIDRIFCTNSYRDIDDPFVSQFKVI